MSGRSFQTVSRRGILRSPVCAAGRDSPLLGSGPRLRHGHRFELLQDAQMVPASSYHLRNLAFGEAQGSGPHPPHPLAPRGDGTCGTLPVSLVGSAPAPNGGDLVALGDLLFDRKPVVREGGEQHLGDVPGALEKIGGHDLLQDGVLAPVMELLEVSADDGLVFFCGHQGLPQLVSLSRNSATLRSSAPLTRNALFTGVRGRGILRSSARFMWECSTVQLYPSD